MESTIQQPDDAADRTVAERSKVKTFFDVYRMAFEAFDAPAIAELFHYPCHITGDADDIEVASILTRDEWLPQIERLTSVYRSAGLRSVEMVVRDVIELTPRLAQASVRWRLADKRGARLYDFDAVYTVADFGDGVRITAIAHNETPHLRALVERRSSA